MPIDTAPTELTQAEVDLLFQIEHGALRTVAGEPGALLLMRGYLAPLPPGHTGYFSPYMVLAGRAVTVQLTYRAHKLLRSIRDGEASAWRCWAPPPR